MVQCRLLDSSHRVSASVGLGRALRICISNNLHFRWCYWPRNHNHWLTPHNINNNKWHILIMLPQVHAQQKGEYWSSKQRREKEVAAKCYIYVTGRQLLILLCTQWGKNSWRNYYSNNCVIHKVFLYWHYSGKETHLIEILFQHWDLIRNKQTKNHGKHIQFVKHCEIIIQV